MGDHEDAHRIATEAGELLLEIRAEAAAGRLDPSQLKDEGDRRSNDLILERLRQAHPDDAVLSEERADDPSRVNADRTWIVDPLDGTREFGEDPRTDWAVHVALVEKGFPTVAAVALPGQGMTLSTLEPPELPPRRRPGRRSWWSAGPARRPRREIVRAALGGDLLPMGSAGAKAMAVVQGEADVYVHGGGQWEWDSAAPVGVAAAAGLHVSRLDGSPARLQPGAALAARPRDLPAGAGRAGAGRRRLRFRRLSRSGASDAGPAAAGPTGSPGRGGPACPGPGSARRTPSTRPWRSCRARRRVWRSTIGGPSSPESQRSPQAIMAASTG